MRQFAGPVAALLILSSNTGWASGARFIGPDGRTLAQMPVSAQKSDSKEGVLIWNVPLAGR